MKAPGVPFRLQIAFPEILFSPGLSGRGTEREAQKGAELCSSMSAALISVATALRGMQTQVREPGIPGDSGNPRPHRTSSKGRNEFLIS